MIYDVLNIQLLAQHWGKIQPSRPSASSIFLFYMLFHLHYPQFLGLYHVLQS
jgi:hypothetical protein